jgi:hypothetical protein
VRKIVKFGGKSYSALVGKCGMPSMESSFESGEEEGVGIEISDLGNWEVNKLYILLIYWYWTYALFLSHSLTCCF